MLPEEQGRELDGWNFQSHPLISGEGRGAEAVFNHAYIAKPPQNPEGGGSESFQDGQPDASTTSVPGPKLQEDRTSFVQELVLCVSPSGC